MCLVVASLFFNRVDAQIPFLSLGRALAYLSIRKLLEIYPFTRQN